jgi:hypothetical protein
MPRTGSIGVRNGHRVGTRHRLIISRRAPPFQTIPPPLPRPAAGRPSPPHKPAAGRPPPTRRAAFAPPQAGRRAASAHPQAGRRAASAHPQAGRWTGVRAPASRQECPSGRSGQGSQPGFCPPQTDFRRPCQHRLHEDRPCGLDHLASPKGPVGPNGMKVPEGRALATGQGPEATLAGS